MGTLTAPDASGREEAERDADRVAQVAVARLRLFGCHKRDGLVEAEGLSLDLGLGLVFPDVGVDGAHVDLDGSFDAGALWEGESSHLRRGREDDLGCGGEEKEGISELHYEFAMVFVSVFCEEGKVYAECVDEEHRRV